MERISSALGEGIACEPDLEVCINIGRFPLVALTGDYVAGSNFGHAIVPQNADNIIRSLLCCRGLGKGKEANLGLSGM